MRQAFELAWANAHVFGKFHHCQNALDANYYSKVNAGHGVFTWTTSGSVLQSRLEPCSTSTHRSAMCK